MSVLLGLEPFQKFGLVGGRVGCGGGQKAFQSSALVQTLDLRLEAWTKLNNKKCVNVILGVFCPNDLAWVAAMTAVAKSNIF